MASRGNACSSPSSSAGVTPLQLDPGPFEPRGHTATGEAVAQLVRQPGDHPQPTLVVPGGAGGVVLGHPSLQRPTPHAEQGREPALRDVQRLDQPPGHLVGRARLVHWLARGEVAEDLAHLLQAQPQAPPLLARVIAAQREQGAHGRLLQRQDQIRVHVRPVRLGGVGEALREVAHQAANRRGHLGLLGQARVGFGQFPFGPGGIRYVDRGHRHGVLLSYLDDSIAPVGHHLLLVDPDQRARLGGHAPTRPARRAAALPPGRTPRTPCR